MENRYTYYLPDIVKELQEFQKLAEIEGDILTEMADRKNEVAENQWILTARRSGLLRLAKMMGFSGAESMETEQLRGEILYQWNSRSPYTYFHLLDWLDACLGEGNYSADLQGEQYRMELVLNLKVKDKKEFLQKHLRNILPANLVLQVKLNANTHEKVGKMTHGQMKELDWTYSQIQLEDLTDYT